MWFIHALNFPSASCFNLILTPNVILGYMKLDLHCWTGKNQEIKLCSYKKNWWNIGLPYSHKSISLCLKISVYVCIFRKIQVTFSELFPVMSRKWSEANKLHDQKLEWWNIIEAGKWGLTNEIMGLKYLLWELRTF